MVNLFSVELSKFRQLHLRVLAACGLKVLACRYFEFLTVFHHRLNMPTDKFVTHPTMSFEKAY